MGNAHRERGNLDAALESYEKARAAFSTLPRVTPPPSNGSGIWPARTITSPKFRAPKVI